MLIRQLRSFGVVAIFGTDFGVAIFRSSECDNTKGARVVCFRWLAAAIINVDDRNISFE